MDFRARRGAFRRASEAVGRDPRVIAMRRSSEIFVELFAAMEQWQREVWLKAQSTAEVIGKSGAPDQRMSMKAFKAEVEDFLTTAFSAANLRGCDIDTQNNQLTQMLSAKYPLMQGFIARLEVQRFCHGKILSTVDNAEIEAFLTEALSAPNMQASDVATQCNELIQLLLKRYPSMQGDIARLDAQKILSRVSSPS